jgi:hypothetical protein
MTPSTTSGVVLKLRAAPAPNTHFTRRLPTFAGVI